MKEKQATAKGGLSATPEAEAADAVYVEATPAQVKAVLAGLAAQPEVFIAVSAEPVEGRRAQEIVRQYQYARRGQAHFRSAPGGGGKTLRDRGPAKRPAKPAESETAPKDGKKPSKLPAPHPAPARRRCAARPGQVRPPPARSQADRPGAEGRAMEQGKAGKPPAEGRRRRSTTQPPASAIRPIRPAATGAVRVAGRRRPAAHRAEGFGQGET